MERQCVLLDVLFLPFILISQIINVLERKNILYKSFISTLSVPIHQWNFPEYRMLRWGYA